MDISSMLNLTVEQVKNSPSKRLVILGEGERREFQDGNIKLILPVEIDGRTTNWILNKPTIVNLANAWGADTITWRGQKVSVQVISSGSKSFILGVPFS